MNRLEITSCCWACCADDATVDLDKSSCRSFRGRIFCWARIRRTEDLGMVLISFNAALIRSIMFWVCSNYVCNVCKKKTSKNMQHEWEEGQLRTRCVISSSLARRTLYWRARSELILLVVVVEVSGFRSASVHPSNNLVRSLFSYSVFLISHRHPKSDISSVLQFNQ